MPRQDRSSGPFYGAITIGVLAGYAAWTGPLDWQRLLVMSIGALAYALFRAIQDVKAGAQ